MSSAIFDDLADFNAILGSRCWLGFTASGLSPDKKRLALLGAQRRVRESFYKPVGRRKNDFAQRLDRAWGEIRGTFAEPPT